MTCGPVIPLMTAQKCICHLFVNRNAAAKFCMPCTRKYCNWESTATSTKDSVNKGEERRTASCLSSQFEHTLLPTQFSSSRRAETLSRQNESQFLLRSLVRQIVPDDCNYKKQNKERISRLQKRRSWRTSRRIKELRLEDNEPAAG
jgi:hypothetical protein